MIVCLSTLVRGDQERRRGMGELGVEVRVLGVGGLRVGNLRLLAQRLTYRQDDIAIHHVSRGGRFVWGNTEPLHCGVKVAMGFGWILGLQQLRIQVLLYKLARL